MARTLMLIGLILCSSTTLITCSTAGLRMELTHVDAKGSYTTAERVQRAIARSRQRAIFRSRQRLASMQATGGVSAPVHWATSQYIAEYLIGNPPQRAEALVDTGIDLIWTPWSGCLANSYVKQNLPYYKDAMYSRSDSFQPVPCKDAMCLANSEHFCARDGSCTFRTFFGNGLAIGSLGTEVFRFQSGMARLAFGIGCVSTTLIRPESIDGLSSLIGLGRGPLSLVSQTSATKFSYCLAPYFLMNVAPSHLFVGASASLSGDSPVMSMPFVKGPENYPFYYVPLVGITVGKTKLPIPSTLFDLTHGGVIIDSGSPFTSLIDGAYRALREELVRQLNGSIVPAPAGSGMELCVARDNVEKAVPALVFHFSGGADMVLPPGNYWVQVDYFTSCMAIGRTAEMSVVGNFQLQNMHLLYDLGRDELFFQTADCSSL